MVIAAQLPAIPQRPVTHASTVHHVSPTSPTLVTVTNLPGPDFFSISAFLVSLATLAAVGYQIFIARKELEAVRKDLENSSALTREAFRRPNLVAVIELFSATHEPSRPAVPGRALVAPEHNAANLKFTVANRGERVSQAYMLRILTPVDKLIYRMNPTDATYLVDDILYMSNDFYSSDFPAYPNGNRQEFLQTHRFKPDIVDATFRWRIFDEFGQYPDQDYGSTTIRVKR